MLIQSFAVTACRHRAISLPPHANVGTCLECRAEVDLDVVERMWATDDPADGDAVG